MRKAKSILLILAAVLFFSTDGQAELQLLGTDNLGHRLIYDTDLNVTWYDFTNVPATWFDQVTWAEDLAVGFGDSTYTNWRLPTTVDGQYATLGTDGNSFAGWNITTSELGHLFYVGLGNVGSKSIVDGSATGCGDALPSCLTHFGDFENLNPVRYYSSDHEGVSQYCWYFDTNTGVQYVTTNYENRVAIAVHPGRTTSEPVSQEATSWGAVKATFR